MFDRKLCYLKISVIALLFLNHGSEFDLFEGWIWSKNLQLEWLHGY